ncbi:chromate transporter [Paraliobacillus salinarum]|uniref:chromate transporter n=1 Tax=Paraliobacillus salinarum TaxID=1158996 RepID=UPI0015F59536|nr:chromate transporter [Paraliobacillus salinarum]
MTYWQLFIAFFIPGVLGYGGGPASIPLVEQEVVDRFEWMTINEFSEMLAMANALPGPIATKMAGFIGFQQAGVIGSLIAVFATVVPSLLLMILLLRLLMKYKDSPKVKRLTMFIRPTIATLLGVMAFQFFQTASADSGFLTMSSIGLISFILMERLRIHPAFVILAALVFGALFLG